ncbi:uncharacterized protein LOC129590232 [Paramacrobiotus metropolitanus]|uniref:uncharacterized protein LOC129590232 n=1 Tax=Paramacrobiotus metropolitanus TaxID=2943436 RepID=UPI00244608C2|nr:uncharacterized protein LOC129590232 [Paramacrobiotus metropolitanus]XP_055341325.1 uncharacterized protein LOC129590232 [Paramacrobiotus metropolitanus]XP_055341326.1 uncharacterized protein LOC129590232 [Paramacrobiotus metropolitanus]XP_055341327.1 uncharacterized protein LOC129590232 [Paramacrobiotus metropolitanus]XP_055341328.1 uncharacterized protein LOC129590232 [Paramacrobiotus metropolitanus]
MSQRTSNTSNIYRKRKSMGRTSMQNIESVLFDSQPKADDRNTVRSDAEGYTAALAQVPFDTVAPKAVYERESDKSGQGRASLLNEAELQKYYVKDPEPICQCGAGPEDVSYRHDACSSVARCQSAKEKRTNRLSSVITADRAENADLPDLSVLGDVSSQLPPNSRSHLENLRKDLRRIQNQWVFEQRVGKVADPEDVERLIHEVQNEKVISNSVFHDVARQAAGECEARGDLLDSIRKKYNSLVSQIPPPLERIANDLTEQRNLDKELATVLLDYQMWWRQRSLPLEKSHQQSESMHHNLEKDIEGLNTTLTTLHSESYQLKSLITLHAAYRARSGQNMQELVLAREEWQDSAYNVCGKGIKDQRLVKLTEMHVLHQMWYIAAKRRYKDLQVLDDNELAQIQTVEKEFLGTLKALEARLIEQETGTVQLVQILRTDIDKKLHHTLFRNYRHIEVLESFSAWQQILNDIAGYFSEEKEADHLIYVQRLEFLFESVVQRTLVLYIKYQKRDDSIASDNPHSQLRKSLRQDVLFTHLDPNYRKTSPIDRDFGAFVASPTESPLYYSNPASPLLEPDAALTGTEFEESLQLFTDLLAKQLDNASTVDYRRDLSVFSQSKPYAELFRLWQMYSDIKLHFVDRMHGSASLRNWLLEMNQSIDLLRADTVSGSAFTEKVCLLLDRTHNMLTLMKNDFSLTSAPKSHNIIKRFTHAATAWSLFSQSALNAATACVLERLSLLFVEMVRCGSELMLLLFPNQLTQKEAIESIDVLRGRTEATVHDLERISAVLDGIVLPPPQHEDDVELRTSSRESSIMELVEKWRIYSALCVNFAYETVSKDLITFLPMSKLAIYDKNTLKEELAYGDSAANYDKALDNILDIPPCLHGVIRDYWIKDDHVEIACVGDDENVYVKPFRLMTSVNTDRTLSSELMEEFSKLSQELSAEKIRTVKLTLKLMELERELAEINLSNQNLDLDVQYYQARKQQTAPPEIALPAMPLVDLEEKMYHAKLLPPLLCVTDDAEPLNAMQPWDYIIDKTFYISDTVILFTSP